MVVVERQRYYFRRYYVPPLRRHNEGKVVDTTCMFQGSCNDRYITGGGLKSEVIVMQTPGGSNGAAKTLIEGHIP